MALSEQQLLLIINCWDDLEDENPDKDIIALTVMTADRVGCTYDEVVEALQTRATFSDKPNG